MHFYFVLAEVQSLEAILAHLKKAAHRIALKGIDHWQYWDNPPAEKINWVKEGLENREFYFVFNREGKEVGFVRILDEDHHYWDTDFHEDPSLYIHSLVVHKAFSGRGTGAHILQLIENMARRQGNDFLRLDCDAGNKKLCAYYENLGFEKVKVKTFPQSQNNLYQKHLN